jgi:hypothetical protein
MKVMTLVERGGRARSVKIDEVTAAITSSRSGRSRIAQERPDDR